jgi:integrase
VRYRYRKAGRKTVYLKGEPWDDEFVASLSAAKSGETVEQKVSNLEQERPYSLRALIALYKISPEFSTLRPSTQSVYGRLLDRLDEDYGHADFRKLSPVRVRKIRDDAEKPTTGNRYVSLLSILGRLAVERGWVTVNPAREVRKRRYEKGHMHDWTDQELGHYLNKYKSGSRERLAFLLLYDTSQRGGDVHLFGPQHLKNGGLTFRQEKTSKSMWIPLQAETLAEIERHKSDQLAFILTPSGRPYKRKSFQKWFSKTCTDIGLPHCSAHGLRGARLRRYAEEGASYEDMKAIGGHETESELRKYIRNASQTRIAKRVTSQMGRLDLATLKKVAKKAEKR